MDQQVSRFWRGLSVLWGVALALLLCRHFFLLPADTFFNNHDENTYLIRLIEFQDCLCSGYLSPQWCTDFRSGLGSPYFSYYQPGIFYAASLLPTGMGPVRQFGWTLVVFAALGYASMLCFVGRRCGLAAGILAGTLFLTCPYAVTDLYIRGDLSEFAAMMLVPALLFLLDSSLATADCRAVVSLTVCGAVVVIMHPCIALFGYGMSAAVVCFWTSWNRDWAAGLRSMVALGLGAGMAAFYWLPVLAECDLVSAEAAFSGHYHYSKHFLGLSDLFGFSVTHTVIPVKVGLLATSVLVVGTVVTMFCWKRLTSDRRRFGVLALLMTAGCLFLMHGTSAPVWDALPLLQQVQFPWRLFSLLSVAIAMTGGVAMSVFGPQGRIAAATVLGLLATLQMFVNATVTPVVSRLPRDAAQIRDFYFAPDLRDEWLPRGAKSGAIDVNRRIPSPGPNATATGYRMAQGILACDVQAASPSYVILPHYYFPVGWTAALNGRPATLTATESGLMQVDLPAGANGSLVLRFGMTPMRRIGLAVSLASALLASAWAWFAVTER